MNTTTETVEPVVEPRTVKNYLTDGHTLKSWLLTTDHKRIGILYLISILFYFLIKEDSAWKIRGVVEVKSEATTACLVAMSAPVFRPKHPLSCVQPQRQRG